MEHPGPGAARLLPGTPGTFYHDLANPRSFAPYRELIEDTPIPDLVAALWGAGPAGADVWYMYEQVFLKEGGDTRRTPWHQDLPYLPVAGERLAVVWITFEPLPAAESLEFVRGSHRGPLYDGSRFDPADETAPLYGTGELPRLPDIEAERARHDIVSWAVEPGDAIVFHPAVLHGGAPTRAGRRRRTLSLRFFGDDAVYARRPGAGRAHVETLGDADVHPLTKVRALEPGEPFRHPGFPRVRRAGEQA